ncbi:hypothetical protein [Kitasatospora sp. NPDC056531]|uniref:hypothetical protein n=1 Tax=Kitasatospora sp. NPDC056531 TaxID=3345856 RepID=UPI0036820B4D
MTALMPLAQAPEAVDGQEQGLGGGVGRAHPGGAVGLVRAVAEPLGEILHAEVVE